MAEHDYLIADQAGTAFLADLNAALAAIVSNNSKATEPTTTSAYMWWVDTTAGVLKQRNSINSAWITIGTLASTNLGLASLAGATFTGLVNLASGANIASAATVDLTLATGNIITITGTTATSALTMNDGQQMVLIAAGAWPLTYNATTMKINGATNFTCAAGDVICAEKTGGVVYVNVTRANGTGILDDSGTWTPNQGAGLTVVGAFSSAGRYVKNGKTLTITGSVSGATSVALAAGGVISSNLPLTSNTGIALGNAMNAAASASSVTYVNTSSTVASGIGAIAATASIYFSVTYILP